MSGIKTKSLLQVTAALIASLLLMGCPLDDEVFFTGDVTIINNTGAIMEYVSIQKTGATASNLGQLAIGETKKFSGYDCITSFTNSAKALLIDADTTDSDSFIPPCGGNTTITWDPGLVPVIS